MRINLPTFIIIAFTFAAGFFTHAFFFPEFLANGITDVSQIAIPNPSPTNKPAELRKLITNITYDGTKFSKHNIAIEAGTYLEITNTSNTTLMSLISSVQGLTTPRGFGQSETVRAQMETKGQFAVADKNNPQERLVITVK